MTLTLSPEIEKALTAAAARQGTTPEQIVTEMVQEKFVLPQETLRRAQSTNLRAHGQHGASGAKSYCGRPSGRNCAGKSGVSVNEHQNHGRKCNLGASAWRSG